VPIVSHAVACAQECKSGRTRGRGISRSCDGAIMAVVWREVAYSRGLRGEECCRCWGSVAMQRGQCLRAEELEGGRWLLRKRRLALRFAHLISQG
jgi:hypothetical protein